ncbi:MAG TPA: hypothetical protein VEP73_03200 [Actinomycetota bacterium]|nr:hypothetical protein [Actinomycetota bacterium]
MAVFFLLVAVLAGAAIGDAIYENTGAGTLVIAQQTTDRFTQGELLAIFAGLGFLLALLLLLAVATAPRRRDRRRALRAARRDAEQRITELQRANARLQADVARRDQTLASLDAELTRGRRARAPSPVHVTDDDPTPPFGLARHA